MKWEQILPDDADWVEASRFASRNPIGFVLCGKKDATVIGWFGRALPFTYDKTLPNMISVGVGLGVDHWAEVRTCDMAVFGMEFLREVEK